MDISNISSLSSLNQASSLLGNTNQISSVINSLNATDTTNSDTAETVNTFSSILKSSIENLVDEKKIDDETASELVDAVSTAATSVIKTNMTETEDDNTAYRLYQDLFSSSTGRKNVQEIVSNSLNSVLFDTDSNSSGIDNFNSLVNALGSINSYNNELNEEV
ncbi:MAG: hypothetical protein K6B41_04545 [Butyrivibrio sp.]|nr:hypothetical protein [Butyrivibrio sp.]